MLSSSNKIIYFDDQKLNELAGILPFVYNNEQIRLLSDVYLTLNENEIAVWLRSLQLRNIQLPEALREQALLIVSERRVL